jgi:hypothetical protein
MDNDSYDLFSELVIYPDPIIGLPMAPLVPEAALYIRRPMVYMNSLSSCPWISPVAGMIGCWMLGLLATLTSELIGEVHWTCTCVFGFLQHPSTLDLGFLFWFFLLACIKARVTATASATNSDRLLRKMTAVFHPGQ